MHNEIRIRFRKDLEGQQHRKLLQLKGQLISNGFTDIIHIHDDGEDYYINSFTAVDNKAAAQDYIVNFCKEQQLEHVVRIL